MRVIARNSARGVALLCLAAAFACADAHDDVMDVITSMAAALTESAGADGGGIARGNVAKFMSGCSKDMPEYDTLKNNVTALVNQGDVSSSIQPLNEEEGDGTYKIDLDWLLQVRSLQQDGPLLRRREVVHCELRKEKKHWKIVSLKPLDFFAPEKLGQ
jgi:hypothetical protein